MLHINRKKVGNDKQTNKQVLPSNQSVYKINP